MTAYEQYQLQWMIDHGYSLKNLMDELTEYQKMGDFADPVSDIFHDWEKEWGFGSEIWACEKEWQECEQRILNKTERDDTYRIIADHLFTAQLKYEGDRKLVVLADSIEDAKKKAAAVLGLNSISVRKVDPTEDPQVYDV